MNHAAIQRTQELIRNESLEHLKDARYLEYRLLPELGLNDRHMHQYPDHLHAHCGRGIDSWQYPNQFSQYLVHLSQLPITNYVEIGCHKGGTFIITWEYLNRFHSMTQGLAVDPWARDRMQAYADSDDRIRYIIGSSHDAEFLEAFGAREWDLTLIDGDHSYLAAQQDWDIVKNRSRWVAFHDIRNVLCPGTQQIWADVIRAHPHAPRWEWCDQYDQVLLRLRGSVMGLGLVDLG